MGVWKAEGKDGGSMLRAEMVQAPCACRFATQKSGKDARERTENRGS